MEQRERDNFREVTVALLSIKLKSESFGPVSQLNNITRKEH